MDCSFTKTILSFDTALGGVSVGVFTADGQKAVRQVETLRDQAAILVPLINEVLEEAGVGYDGLDMIVTTRGPGSFTGLRIGLSTARALGLALQKPVIGMSTLKVVAAQLQSELPVLSVLETKRKDFYLQEFNCQKKEIGAPLALEAEEIKAQITNGPYILVGDACARFEEGLGEEWMSAHISDQEQVKLIDPEILAFAGQGAEASQNPAVPLYLRGADVSQPKNPPRRLAQ